MRAEDAVATLREIAEGRTSPWLLPWIPLMKNGGKPTMMEEWKRLAIAEPNPRSRAEYASLALVFAELTRHRGQWQRALEGWNMRESAVVNGWKAEGIAEGRRDAILQILRLRFPAEIRPDLLASVEAQHDLGKLSQWIVSATKAASIEEFRTLAGL